METNRNDDQVELDSSVLPALGGRKLRASEVNSLTRACISATADVNDNSFADQAESQGNMSAPNPAEQAWLDFSYFLELDIGAFSPPSGGATYGTYHITEKPRGGGPGKVAPVYGAAGYWDTCGTRPDSAFRDGLPAQGMDFARFVPESGFRGMNHHSQFKCMFIVGSTNAGSPPNEITYATFRSRSYINNDCALSAGAGPIAPASGPNPSDAPVVCAAGDQNAALANGAVVWAAMPFTPYANPAAYVRGCVDECVETAVTCAQCPFTSTDCTLNPAYCVSSAAQYGKHVLCSCPQGQYVSGTACVPHSCGDSVVYNEAYGNAPGMSGYEYCDLGGQNSNAPNASCRTDCTNKRCGDNVTDTGEQCDTGTLGSAPSQCRVGCLAPFW